MRGPLNFFLLVFLSFSGDTAADEIARPEVCQSNRTRVRAELNAISLEYRASEKSQTVEKLVAMDHRLRALLSNRPICNGAGDDNGLDTPPDAAIGVLVEHYSVMFWYSGKMLAEAHRLNPRSPLRSSTLYATVERVSPDGKFSAGTPDFKAAKTYLHEFPSGPFALDATMALAKGYGHAYATLNLSPEMAGQIGEDGIACVAESLGDLGGKTRQQLLVYTKAKAEYYFKLAFRIRRPTTLELVDYQAWRESRYQIGFYCPD